MRENELCPCEEKHRGHLCELRYKGLTHRIRQVTDSPNIACLKCGEEANSEDNVCLPVALFI